MALGTTAATRAKHGGDGWLSGGCENARGRRKNDHREREESKRGLVRVAWRLEKGRGREEASREVATAIARASTRLCLLAEVEDDRLALVGWAFATVAGRR